MRIFPHLAFFFLTRRGAPGASAQYFSSSATGAPQRQYPQEFRWILRMGHACAVSRASRARSVAHIGRWKRTVDTFVKIETHNVVVRCALRPLRARLESGPPRADSRRSILPQVARTLPPLRGAKTAREMWNVFLHTFLSLSLAGHRLGRVRPRRRRLCRSLDADFCNRLVAR